MEYRVLGPLETIGGGRDLTPGAAKQRVILALLVLCSNSTVQVSTIMDEIWGERPPESALATLQTYVYKLRKILDKDCPGAGNKLLRKRGNGYQLEVDGEQLDLVQLERYDEDGRNALVAGRLEQARTAFSSALALWRGPVLANVSAGTLISAEVTRLEERRLRTLELRMDADLRLGNYRSLIGELKALIMTHPLNENFYARLMRVLALAGRPHEALDVYRQLRKTFNNELGMDPSLELRSLQEAILASRPLNPPESSEVAPVTRSGGRAPSQFPPDLADFVGRRRELAYLERQLVGGAGSEQGDAVGRVVSLIGGPGVGKTTLAVRLAHQVKHHFPDGQFYAGLRGTGPEPAEPAETLTRFLRAAKAVPPGGRLDPEDATQLFRAWCASKQVLMVLDDATSVWQIEALMPCHSGCGLIVTSRFVHDLPGARRMQLDPLPTGDGLRLLANIIGRGRVDTEIDAALEILRLVDGLPLAVRAAGTRLAAAPRMSLRLFARQLSGSPAPLSELSVGDIDIRARFSSSYDKLKEREKWAFRLLGLVGDRCFRARDVAKLLGCSPAIVDTVLTRLVEYQLLTVEGGEVPRYGFPALVRVFAGERLAEVAGPGVEIRHLEEGPLVAG